MGRRDEVNATERVALARQGARHLYECGARSVWLFGSLARGRPQDARSDIDLAVEGLPGDQFYLAVSELGDLLHVAIDLVELETATPALRAAIARDGILLERS